MEPRVRGTVAIDETVIKINGERFYLYAALDVERNEVVWMRVYPARNYLTTKDFIKNVLKYCENQPRFLVDRGPWYKDAFRDLKLSYTHETFGERSKVEAVFSSYKQRSRVYFNNFNLNFRAEPKKGDPALWSKRALQLANLFAVTFMLYYNQLR